MPFNYKFITLFLIFICISFNASKANTDNDFKVWVSSFKEIAVKKGISQETVDKAFLRVKFLENVIKYDRKQPEFLKIQKHILVKGQIVQELEMQKRF